MQPAAGNPKPERLDWFEGVPRLIAKRIPSLRSPVFTITRRGWAVLLLAVLMYLAANQTQVAWLYVFSALVVGVWLAAAFIPTSSLRGLALARRINGAELTADLELHVGAPVAVELELRNTARAPALQISGAEQCPFAPSAERAQTFFAPIIPSRNSVVMQYATACARRGWFEFPPVTLTTRAPFGFFRAQRALAQDTGLLIFPEYRKLDRFPMLDRRPALQNPFAHMGMGGEFIGTREYRPGDSPRHVHWRSTARSGQLIVKEFAEETQPGLTLALDLRAASAIGTEDDNTLERAIKAAATIAHYADQHGLPLALATNSPQWPAPPSPLSGWALMNYLARVQAGGEKSFAECLRGLRATVFVAALLPAPDDAAIAPLIELKKQGVSVLAVLIDPSPFAPEYAGRSQSLAGALSAGGVAVRVIGAEPDWEHSLVADDRAAVRW